LNLAGNPNQPAIPNWVRPNQNSGLATSFSSQ
jgi:hypothetical protein